MSSDAKAKSFQARAPLAFNSAEMCACWRPCDLRVCGDVVLDGHPFQKNFVNLGSTDTYCVQCFRV